MSTIDDFYAALEAAAPGEHVVYGVETSGSMGLRLAAQDAMRAGVARLFWKRIDGVAHAIAVRTDAPFVRPETVPRSAVRKSSLVAARAAIAEGKTPTDLAAELGIKRDTARKLMHEAQS